MIIVAGALFYSHRYEMLLESSLTTIADKADTQLEFNQEHYERARKQTRSIVTLLSHDPALYDYFFEPTKEQDHLTKSLSAMMASLEWYNRIRFIDADGNEKISMAYQADNQLVQQATNLQNINNTELFAFLTSIPDQTVDVWGARWVNPSSVSSQPPEAVFYVATPVTLLGQRHGYVVLDVSLSTMYQKILISPQRGFHLQILNQDGQYIAGSSRQLINSQQEMWSGDRFNTLYPRSWDVIQKTHRGVLTENNHLIIYRRVALSDTISLTMLVNLSPQQLQHEIQYEIDALKNEAYFVLLIMLLFALPAAMLGYHYHRRNIESKLAHAALHGMSAVAICDAQYRIKLVNKTFEKAINIRGSDIEGMNMLDFLLSEYDSNFKHQVMRMVQEHSLWRGEINYIAPNGELLVVLVRFQAVLERGQVSYYIISLIDISERKALENRLRKMSELDDMTKLWNRRKFEIEIKEHANRVKQQDGIYSILVLLDIDYFKLINDELGHDEGDRVIIYIASTLTKLVRTTDFVARIGGEEFAIIMPNTSVEEATQLMNSIRQHIAEDKLARATVSVGITDITEDRTQTYKWADVALYSAKSDGRNRVSICLSSEEIA